MVPFSSIFCFTTLHGVMTSNTTTHTHDPSLYQFLPTSFYYHFPLHHLFYANTIFMIHMMPSNNLCYQTHKCGACTCCSNLYASPSCIHKYMDNDTMIRICACEQCHHREVNFVCVVCATHSSPPCFPPSILIHFTLWPLNTCLI